MEMKPKLLVSACLLGQPVRYDGQAKPLSEQDWRRLRQKFDLIAACPECMGGLPTRGRRRNCAAATGSRPCAARPV